MSRPRPVDPKPLVTCAAFAASELSAAAARALRPAIVKGLGFDLPEAVRRRQVRLVLVHTRDGSPLPANWAIPIDEHEVVVACEPLEPPIVGVAALVVAGEILPQATLDEPTRERVAQALADLLLAEIRGRSDGTPRR